MPPREDALILLLKEMAADRQSTAKTSKWQTTAMAGCAIIMVLFSVGGGRWTSQSDATIDKRVSLLEKQIETDQRDLRIRERDIKLLDQYNRELIDFLHAHRLNAPASPVLGREN